MMPSVVNDKAEGVPSQQEQQDEEQKLIGVDRPWELLRRPSVRQPADEPQNHQYPKEKTDGHGASSSDRRRCARYARRLRLGSRTGDGTGGRRHGLAVVGGVHGGYFGLVA